MKTTLLPFFLFLATAVALANTAPTPVILSAAMRPGTTLMDVVYRVNDPDDATVKVRALAFVDGVRSFANVVRPVTFVEGTAANIGDGIAANANHVLTWDVAADVDLDLVQVKFEILCRDGRGLLEFDWITIPPAGDQPALTISKDTPSDASVLNALYWQYADGDTGLTLTNGVLSGNAMSGVFLGLPLANGTALQSYSTPYVFKRMSLDPASSTEVSYAAVTARAELTATTAWHAANRPYLGISMVVAWGENGAGQTAVSAGIVNVVTMAAGQRHSLGLNSDGTLVGWGSSNYGESTVPAGLTSVTAIAAGDWHSLALKSNGTVVAWGNSGDGRTTVPAGLSEITAIAGGGLHSLALKSNGTVVAWGNNGYGQTTIPPGLTAVTAIAAGEHHSLALKSDGTVVAWGNNGYGQVTVPAGLTRVTAIASGYRHSLALKNDGTVVGWGGTTVPAGLGGVTAIAGGYQHSLALKSDGTVVGWGVGHGPCRFDRGHRHCCWTFPQPCPQAKGSLTAPI